MQSFSNMEVVKLIGQYAAPVLSAILTGYFFARYKNREDNIDKRCDELCLEITKLGECSNSYWAAGKKIEEMAVLEARVTAGWSRVSGLRVLLESFVSESSKEEVLEAEKLMFQLTTGGNFGSKNLRADPRRARSSILEAANFCNAVRNARMHDTHGLFRRN
jgi:hypothetical protein